MLWLGLLGLLGLGLGLGREEVDGEAVEGAGAEGGGREGEFEDEGGCGWRGG